MKLSRFLSCSALAVSLCLGQAVVSFAAPASTSKPHAAPAVEPQALDALKRMSDYLIKLQSFEVKADTTLDNVYDNGQKLQFGGQIDYKVRRPNGFMVEVTTDRKLRDFYYDGKSFTEYAPAADLYAKEPAPPTIWEVLKIAQDKYGIDLPLVDLFRWSDPNGMRAESLQSGIYVGYAKINGVEADQYAFREGDIDWQVWIASGARPLPLKFVITSNWLEGAPQFVSTLTWTENPTFTDDTFTFKPGPHTMGIHFAAVEQ